jgi:hypothetical protein
MPPITASSFSLATSCLVIAKRFITWALPGPIGGDSVMLMP